MILGVVLAALVLDNWLGEAKRFHPLVGFGKLANAIEAKTYGASRSRGLLAWCMAVIPLSLLAIMLPNWAALDALVLYLVIGRKSLKEHALAIYEPLQQSDTERARYHLSMIVSRDTETLNNQGISKAAVESVLENGSDSIFAAIFWFVIGGVPAVLLYRMANTLDAMWGYQNQRYRDFGYAAAKIDDALNYIPARLVAMSYAAMGHFSNAMQAWRAQARFCSSPNAGPVMSSGAGALNVVLGGEYQHGGVVIQKPQLGFGDEARPCHITAALALIDRSLILWLVVLAVLSW